MFISKNIPISAKKVVEEIMTRQGMPWGGRISEYHSFPALQELFQIVNSGVPKEDFFFQGDIYRLHSPCFTSTECIDPETERVIGKVCSDGSCKVLPITQYSDSLVAFSKSYDFTDHRIYYKVAPNQRSILIHINTNKLYGIDVNVLLNRFGVDQWRYEGEQEILFPLLQEYVVKEYEGTPNKFKYYLRNLPSNQFERRTKYVDNFQRKESLS